MKFTVIILSILTVISACSSPETTPEENKESAATQVINTTLFTEPPATISPFHVGHPYSIALSKVEL